MPQILSRDEDFARRRDRLKMFKRGPGTFVYDGSWCDTEWIPTFKTVGKNVPAFTSSGVPVLDAAGRQVFVPVGDIVRDDKGRPVLGGEPERKKIPLDTVKIWGVALPKGVPVKVDASLALKLRRMDGFNEVDEKTVLAPEFDEKPLHKMSKGELLELAANEGIRVDEDAKKAEIVVLLEQAQSAMAATRA